MADLIRNLRVFASTDLKVAAPGLGARWLTADQLMRGYGPAVPEEFLFSAGPEGGVALSMAEVVRVELADLTQEQILADWGALSYRVVGNPGADADELAAAQP